VKKASKAKPRRKKRVQDLKGPGRKDVKGGTYNKIAFNYAMTRDGK
jgi:hypothetical protein